MMWAISSAVLVVAEMPVPSAQFVIVQQKVVHGQPQVSREVSLCKFSSSRIRTQLGANHTFLSIQKVQELTWSLLVATTIMSYAGTGFDDIAFYADNYYHNVSVCKPCYLVDQSCDVSTDNGNSLPVITPQPNILSYSIPIGTPSILKQQQQMQMKMIP